MVKYATCANCFLAFFKAFFNRLAADELLAKIVDEESVQMQGLANLSTRPWAEGALQQR